ncbi:hypothetical protein, variant [Sphaeroforma arctica JP610]|uniref:Uncharacterized protein n=1 Tax=Sphaeroforma arctica JP610 TaxID=667725 RepID=A0A0L0GEN6_9EUKA|nr:hypothetical protein, variant [Sphaeroforma arctica JP610]KNC87480.1 hypothetical protein, variant [Sphaeroforma arctica JP610]|eukprot:XP_014161382.1 hypothetical protein, variant [Sphaeroforma arctica JP610]
MPSNGPIAPEVLRYYGGQPCIEIENQLHGSVGASITVQVTEMDVSIENVTIEVHKSDVRKVWSALTMLSSYQGQRCRVLVRESTSLQPM